MPLITVINAYKNPYVQFAFSMAFQLISFRLIFSDYLSDDWKPNGMHVHVCVCVSIAEYIQSIENLMCKIIRWNYKSQKDENNEYTYCFS